MVKERTKKLILVYFLLLIPFSLVLYPLWGVQLLLWAGLFLFITRNKLETHLDKRFEKLFYFVSIVYPAIEIVIKIIILYNLIPYSWMVLNRIEHGLFSFCMFFILLPISYRFAKRDLIIAGLLNFLAVNLIGNLNEVFEFGIRLFWNLEGRFAAYYSDTLIDMIMNMLGSGLAWVLIPLQVRKNRKKD